MTVNARWDPDLGVFTPTERARLVVETFELDGECDHLSRIAARLPAEFRRELVTAIAAVERVRDRMLRVVEP